MPLTAEATGYGTDDDPHGWLWLKAVRDRAAAAPSPGGVTIVDNGDGTLSSF